MKLRFETNFLQDQCFHVSNTFLLQIDVFLAFLNFVIVDQNMGKIDLLSLKSQSRKQIVVSNQTRRGIVCN